MKYISTNQHAGFTLLETIIYMGLLSLYIYITSISIGSLVMTLISTSSYLSQEELGQNALRYSDYALDHNEHLSLTDMPDSSALSNFTISDSPLEGSLHKISVNFSVGTLSFTTLQYVYAKN